MERCHFYSFDYFWPNKSTLGCGTYKTHAISVLDQLASFRYIFSSIQSNFDPKFQQKKVAVTFETLKHRILSKRRSNANSPIDKHKKVDVMLEKTYDKALKLQLYLNSYAKSSQIFQLTLKGKIS
jgi:hypothetical protein